MLIAVCSVRLSHTGPLEPPLCSASEHYFPRTVKGTQRFFDQTVLAGVPVWLVLVPRVGVEPCMQAVPTRAPAGCCRSFHSMHGMPGRLRPALPVHGCRGGSCTYLLHECVTELAVALVLCLVQCLPILHTCVLQHAVGKTA